MGCGGDDNGASPEDDDNAPHAPGAPNLIVVMTDDQTFDSFGPEAMPKTWKLFHDDRSAIFSDAVASPPLCCPARAGFITGQYPHNHGVLGNVPGYADLIDKPSVLPVWLDRAGYRTALMGKYLNQYELVGGKEAAPGWDSWFAMFGYPAYYNYTLNDNGEVSTVGSKPADYSTTRITDYALEELDAAGNDPLFAWLAYNAPHIAASSTAPCDGELPEPPDRAAYEEFADAELPKDPSFDEADRSDKPRAIKSKSALSDATIDDIELRWRCGLATLRPLDDDIARLVGALEDSGELERTVLVFVSDNGYFFGSHAIDDDKRLPYAQSSHVPMAIRVGSKVAAGPPPAEIDEVVSNVDLAPTLLDYAKARPCVEGKCRDIDGTSLLPLLSGEPDRWPEDRAVLLELNESIAYEALRTRRYLYSELTRDRAGELPHPAIELYDLDEDPYELENLAVTDPGENAELLDEMARRLERLASCSGKSCE